MWCVYPSIILFPILISQTMNKGAFLFGICMLGVSCTQKQHVPTEAEMSAFGDHVYQMDSTLQGNWFSRMGVSADADSLLAYLRRELPRNGLDTTAFFVPQIAEDLSIVHTLAFDSLGLNINEVLLRLEENLTRAYVDYTTGQRYGFMRPDKVLNRLQLKPDSSGYVRLFDYEIHSANFSEAEEHAASDSYDRLSWLFDSTPKGNVYHALQNRLLQSTDKSERRRLAINMERCRWQTVKPDDKERWVVVNIPSQQLWAVCPDSILNMRICCGATVTKTPLLSSVISYFQVNPEWIIPQKIVNSDIARHAGDSAYFARNRYYIVRRSSGDTLQTSAVTASDLRSGTLRVGQKGGRGNSLGRIVFRFPNNFAVYLHDTNNRGAFSRDRRTLSHGCVRVEKPFELACFLMPDADDWLKDRLRISMDIAPETMQGTDYLEEHADDPQPYRLLSYREVSPSVPVHIEYFTAYPNPETGFVESWPDLYGYDDAVGREIAPFILKR